MFSYNLLSKTSFNINSGLIDAIFSEINDIVPKSQLGTLNIILMSDEEIKKLNSDYRGINKVTDVLSFHYYDDFKNLRDEEIAGEIVMNEKLIYLQGEEFQHGAEKEFYKLLIHSVLHILGYDHETDSDYKVMKDLEDKIWKII
ncbi:rRNA maturation RNase YbeY [Candidatus Gracilibacteria bacterium]|nr:MAG: rRNA maturation RNase YbeY [Candidatus Gracilibacteria bacterium]